jgi:putative flippase GtrA
MMVEVVGMAVLPGQALSFLCAAAASYLAHKHFSFRRRPPPSAHGTHEREG